MPAGLNASTRLWDAPTRIVHWALVALVAFAWWSAEAHQLHWHRLAGYAILGLVLFRLFWGVVGSRTARFAAFVRGPAHTVRYLATLPSRTHAPSPGHNPLGAWSILAILAVLIVQVVTGLFSVDVDGVESGPLSAWVDFDTGRGLARVHHWSFNALEALIVLHLAAVAFYALYKRADLVRPMLTGRVRFRLDPAPDFAPGWRLVLAAAVAVALAVWVAKGVPL